MDRAQQRPEQRLRRRSNKPREPSAHDFHQVEKTNHHHRKAEEPPSPSAFLAHSTFRLRQKSSPQKPTKTQSILATPVILSEAKDLRRQHHRHPIRRPVAPPSRPRFFVPGRNSKRSLSFRPNEPTSFFTFASERTRRLAAEGSRRKTDPHFHHMMNHETHSTLSIHRRSTTPSA